MATEHLIMASTKDPTWSIKMTHLSLAKCIDYEKLTIMTMSEGLLTKSLLPVFYHRFSHGFYQGISNFGEILKESCIIK